MPQGSFTLEQSTIDDAQPYAPGYTFGRLAHTANKDTNLVGTSSQRPDQSKIERIAEQRGDFFYGGSATGRQDAIDAARANLSPYTGQLNSYGGAFFGQGMAAGDRAAPLDYGNLNMDRYGQSGQYGIALEMQRAADMGPGPSQAQAQLDASTAQAMRQQLAIAGSGRGAGGGASAFRQAGANQAQIAGQANAQAAVLRAQEENAWRQHQAGLLAQAGSLYGQGRAADINAANYYSGTQLGQAGLNDQYALGMGQLATGAIRDAGELQMGTEGLANQVNMGALSGSMAYEDMMTNIYGINKGVQQPNQMNPYVAAGLETAGNVLPFLDPDDE